MTGSMCDADVTVCPTHADADEFGLERRWADHSVVGHIRGHCRSLRVRLREVDVARVSQHTHVAYW